MSEKRRGLGKGLGALIPSAPVSGRPVDVFFPDQRPAERAARGDYVARPGSTPAADSSGSAPSAGAAKSAATTGAGKAKTDTTGTEKTGAATSGGGATGSGKTGAKASPSKASTTRNGTGKAGAKSGAAKSGTTKAATTKASATKAAAQKTGTPQQASGQTTAARRGGSKRASIPADTLTPRRRSAADSAAASESLTSDGATSEVDVVSEPAAITTKSTPTPPSAASPVSVASSPSSAADDELVEVPGATFAEVAVTDVVANRRQPRQVFDEEELEELAASIREVGVLQPIVVRPLSDDDEAGYELIMGERRWRASQLAGNETVPAIVRQVEDDDLLRDALLENLHRTQLNPLEEAAAYQQLLEDFDCTHEELAIRIARSRPQISNTLRLLKLPPLVQRRLAAGVLSSGHARALLGLSDAAAMERLAQRVVAEGLSVRTTEEIVALGDEPIEPELRRRPRSSAHTAELNEVATKLSDRFDTRVKIGMGQRKGKINIEFASVADLNRILEVLAPNVERISTEPESPQA